ncbi:MAG: HIT family protein [Patescibacteria group bacterium]
MATIFSKIIGREIPGHFIYEDDMCVVIMDKYPAVPGQSMVILKREIEYIFDVDDAEYNHLFTIAKKVAQASDRALNVERSCLVVEGLEVPHVHLKIYPLPAGATSLSEVMGKKAEAEDSRLAELALKIKSHLAG